MGFLKKRGPNRMERLLAASRLQEAMGRIESARPLPIHNPDRGARWHYRDPSFPAAHPVCGASGTQWAEGDGGLKPCGLCPPMWAQRQAGSGERAAS
jgi:hypothetical protein